MADHHSIQPEDDRILDELANFGPVFDEGTMYRLEEAAASKERGQQRRLCLAACSRPADMLSKISIESPEAFQDMLEMVEAFAEHAKGLSELAETALLRMQISDCRGANTQAS